MSLCPQVRIVDMYVVEGPKLFYRLAISALKIFAALSQCVGECVCVCAHVSMCVCGMMMFMVCVW